MKKILITGGAGNIGASLFNKLIKNTNYFIYVLDNFSTGRKDNLNLTGKENFKILNSDINNFKELKKIFQNNSFNYIFHYAATVGVQRTQNNPLEVLKDIEGIKNILNLTLEKDIERIFFSSSSEVYGEAIETPQNELTTPLNSRIPYAIVKNVSEAFLKSYNKVYGTKYTILRFFNTYGPLQNEEFVISKFVKKALNNENLTIYGDGKQTRSFLYIDDNIDFTIKLLENNLFINETVNVGSDIEISIIELSKKIIKITNSDSKIIFSSPLLEGDMLKRLPDISKMKKNYSNELIKLDEGLRKIIKNFKIDEQNN